MVLAACSYASAARRWRLQAPRSWLSVFLLVPCACGGRTTLELLPNDSNGASGGVHSGGAPNAGAAPGSGGSLGSSGSRGATAGSSTGAASSTGGAFGASGAVSAGGRFGAGNGNGGEGGTPASGRGGGGSAGSAGSAQHLFAIGVTAGTDMSCAVERGGSVWCWGTNQGGQLGDGTLNDSRVPVRVANLENVLAVHTGGMWNSDGMHGANSAFACARLADGTLDCWGEGVGLLSGDSSTPFSPVPLPIPQLKGAADVATGNRQLCVLAGGSVSCWGDDRWGQLGDGGQTNCSGTSCPGATALTPVRVAGVDGAVAISARGSDFTCALMPDASVRCWGLLPGTTSTTGSPTPVTMPGVTGSTSGLSAGFSHACAMPASGSTIQCWGSNGGGELGDGTDHASSLPVTVKGLAGQVKNVSAGFDHSCAALADGRAQCWGDNQWGELGDGTLVSSATAVTVSGISDAVGVSAGYHHTCVLTRLGRVLCWGRNFVGQVGNGDPAGGSVTTPVIVSGF